MYTPRAAGVPLFPSTKLADALLRKSVADLIPQEAVHVPPDAKLREVRSLMRKSPCRLVVVCTRISMHPVGIFTRRDLSILSTPESLTDETRLIALFMTLNPFCISPQDSIGSVVIRMIDGGLRCVPSVDTRGRLTGILTLAQLLKFVSHRLTQAAKACLPRTRFTWAN